MNAKIVVAGHKSVGAADLPADLAASQRYLRDFTTLAKKGGTVEDLVHGMLELHGERDQPHTLWVSARAEDRPTGMNRSIGQRRPHQRRRPAIRLRDLRDLPRQSHSGLSTVGRRSRAGLDSQGQVASISNRG